MNGRLAFFGLLAAATLFSWCGLVQWPSAQMAELVPKHPELRDGQIVEAEGDVIAKSLYRWQGCFVCHTRQVGPADIAYGWETERTGPVAWARLGIPPEGADGVVGLSRIGPDLSHLSGRYTPEALARFLSGHHAMPPDGTSSPERLAAWLLQSEKKDERGARP
ncbi:hypothetical protein SAMN05444156_1110 [Verrucomicrobium sp. GAS474]|uniref:hypothetical protein n=1 Tax=Verrucomicrobium sp. GAS474 TaxID=1882831 RepID=UPI00087D5FE6|nr:hypothetical protein [Verrucomicrobium sp. GAS474]SDT96453.1 hypothetical protein SAMN05444156_1110 [Verrucomicrobium sp. GAS474]